METIKSLKSKTKHGYFKLSLLKPKKKKPLQHKAIENMSHKTVNKDIDKSKSKIYHSDLSTSSDKNYQYKIYGDSYPALKIDNQKNGEQKTAIDKDTSSNDVIENELNYTEPVDYLDKDVSIKEIKSNNSESSIINTSSDNCQNIFKIKDQIESNDNQIESKDNMKVQKSIKRRRIELNNSKLNSSKKPRTDKHEDLQNVEIITEQTKIDERRKTKTEPSKLNDENGTKIINSIVEKSKMKKEKKTDTNKTKSPNKKAKKELNNSESLFDLNFMYNVSETSIKEIDRIEENSKHLPTESDTVMDNGPGMTKTHLKVINRNERPELNNSKPIIDSEDHKHPSTVNSISQSNVDMNFMDKHLDLSKSNDKNDTEKTEIKTEPSKTPKKIDSGMNKGPEKSLDELNNTKPKTDTKITNYFSRSKSIDNKNDINEIEIEQPQSFLIQKGKLRRKSISKSLFEAIAITGDQGCSKIQTEDKTETAELNNIKTNTRKRLKSTTSRINIPKNIDQIDLKNSEHIIEPETSKSFDDLVDSKSSIDNPRSNANHADEEDGDISLQKRETRQKSISSKLFDEHRTKKSQVNIEQPNERLKPASNLQKLVKNPSKTSESSPSLSIVGNEDLNNSKSAIDTPVEDNVQETLNSVNEIFEEPQQIPVQPIKRGRGRPKSTVPKSTTPKIKTPKKINITTQLKKLKLKPAGKVTKHSIKETSYRKIPQNRLEGALDMLQNEDHPIWVDHNVSCNAGIHRYWEPRNALMSDQNMKLKYARQFLLRRDWLNLSKVLCLSTIDTKQKTNYYPLLAKYATLCLAHTDKEQFNKFVQFLIGMDQASSSVMKKCTKIVQENEE